MEKQNYLLCTNPCHKMILMRMVLEVKCTRLHTDFLLTGEMEVLEVVRASRYSSEAFSLVLLKELKERL